MGSSSSYQAVDAWPVNFGTWTALAVVRTSVAPLAKTTDAAERLSRTYAAHSSGAKPAPRPPAGNSVMGIRPSLRVNDGHSPFPSCEGKRARVPTGQPLAL